MFLRVINIEWEWDRLPLDAVQSLFGVIVVTLLTLAAVRRLKAKVQPRGSNHG
jgi:hypothetical protein